MNEKNCLGMFVSQLRLMFTMVYILSYCYAAGSWQIVMAENATGNSKCRLCLSCRVETQKRNQRSHWRKESKYKENKKYKEIQKNIQKK